jgi:anti-sigma factor RsiW
VNVLRDDELHAYLDGVLDEARRAEVEALLDQQPEKAERVRAYRQLDSALRTFYDPVLEEPVPERLLQRPAPRGQWWTPGPWWARTALAAGLMVLGIGIGWFGRGAFVVPGIAPTLAKQAAVAHAVYAPEVRHPVEVGADDQDHLVRWLSKRLGTDLKCPKLVAFGYDLVGGRLLSGQTGPVAHFMYQDNRGRRLTLYVTAQRDTRQTAFRFSQEGGVSVFYWIDGRYGYALSGEIPRDQLLAVANTVYQQLNP